MLLTNWMDGWMNGFGEKETLRTRTATEKKIKKSISFLTYIHTHHSLVSCFLFFVLFLTFRIVIAVSYKHIHALTYIHTRIHAQTHVSSSFIHTCT